MSDSDKIEASCTIQQTKKRKVQQESKKWTEAEINSWIKFAKYP